MTKINREDNRFLLYNDALSIAEYAISESMPDKAVQKIMSGLCFRSRRVIPIAIGKAACSMANAVSALFGCVFERGIVVTKYGSVKDAPDGFDIFEAGHPLPDGRSFYASEAVISRVSSLTPDDTVLLLISGGGSALFEKPLISEDEFLNITDALLKSGACINEINTVRKHLSAVKGGRFAELCSPAKVVTIALSDVIGDDPGVIASGPTYPDSSTSNEALRIVEKYGVKLSENALVALKTETPKSIGNSDGFFVIGSVRQLCEAAAQKCVMLGYETTVLTSSLCCNARDAGSMLASIAREHAGDGKSLAFIMGGETVVKVTGNGLGGRNQEIALSAASGISGIKNAAVFSVGSDGTDGPTDAAGGYVDGFTSEKLESMGINTEAVLNNNDSYNALKKVGGLIITGPTGTNVNDISVLLIRS